MVWRSAQRLFRRRQWLQRPTKEEENGQENLKRMVKRKRVDKREFEENGQEEESGQENFGLG